MDNQDTQTHELIPYLEQLTNTIRYSQLDGVIINRKNGKQSLSYRYRVTVGGVRKWVKATEFVWWKLHNEVPSRRVVSLNGDITDLRPHNLKLFEYNHERFARENKAYTDYVRAINNLEGVELGRYLAEHPEPPKQPTWLSR